jgi:hypothetical protein
MSHHNLEQISETTLILTCAGVFISPELIKAAKMCRLHRGMFGIYGNPVPSSTNARFMEMLNKKVSDMGTNVLLQSTILTYSSFSL